MLRVLIILCIVFVVLAAIRGALMALRGRARRRARGAAKARAQTAAEAQAIARARGLLGVRAGASAADVRAAYRDRAARAHPDAGGSAAHMAELTAARDLLLSTEDRKAGK